MKKLAALVLFFIALSTTIAAKPKESLRDKVSKSTVALYFGKQFCKFDEGKNWSCEFKSFFTCTATVVKRHESGDYLALTAGHCFNQESLDDYYVADDVMDKPVLRHVKVEKFESDGRYDYGIVSFTSIQDYPLVAVNDTDEGVPAIGTEVLNVNYSYGLGKQVVEGKVTSGALAPSRDNLRNDNAGRYLVSVGVAPGASGSAIVDARRGVIVGLVEAIFPGTQMSTLCVPTGAALLNFEMDDSAGLKKLPQPAYVPAVVYMQAPVKDISAERLKLRRASMIFAIVIALLAAFSVGVLVSHLYYLQVVKGLKEYTASLKRYISSHVSSIETLIEAEEVVVKDKLKAFVDKIKSIL
jgi:hypothetical protein